MNQEYNKMKGYLIMSSEGLRQVGIKGRVDKLKEDLRIKLLEISSEYLALSKIRDHEDRGKKVHRSHHDLFNDYTEKVYKLFRKINNTYY
jgi:hypothetical protein